MTQVFHVRSWRKKMGWTRKEAAEKLGVSAHTIKSYELHRRDLSKPIQQLMVHFENQKDQEIAESSLADDHSNPNNTVLNSSILIVGGAFATSSLNTTEKNTTEKNTTEKNLSDSDQLMLFKPCNPQTALDVHALCQASERESQILLGFHQSSSIQTIDQLSEQLERFNKLNVLFLACSSPFDRFAINTISSCISEKTTTVSFGTSRPESGDVFGDFLFIEESLPIKRYAVLNSTRETVVQWNDDKDLVLAQLLEIVMPRDIEITPDNDKDIEDDLHHLKSTHTNIKTKTSGTSGETILNKKTKVMVI